MPPKTHRDRQLGSQNSSWGRLGRLGCVLGSSRRRLGPSWGRLGGVLGHLGCVLGRLGSVLGRLEDVLVEKTLQHKPGVSIEREARSKVKLAGIRWNIVLIAFPRKVPNTT